MMQNAGVGAARCCGWARLAVPDLAVQDFERGRFNRALHDSARDIQRVGNTRAVIINNCAHDYEATDSIHDSFVGAP